MPESYNLPQAMQRSSVAILANWQTLAENRYFDPSLLRPAIAASWERCLELSVDPWSGSQSFGLASAEIFEAGETLTTIARTHMRTLFQGLPGQGYMVMLYDKEGHILSMLGDRKTIRLAESLNVYTGVRHTEAVLGTFAPGICLAEGKPTEVLWHEHYKEIYHGWCCSAVPIYSGPEQVIGVLDVTSVGHLHHARHTLALARMAAKAIESELRYASMHRGHQRLGVIYTSLFPSDLVKKSEPEIPERILLNESRDAPVRYGFNHIVYKSAEMANIISQARRIAHNNYTVLVSGESGTGKELLCQGIHWAGIRKNGPLIAVNCAGLPHNLVQSELFGYEGGSFTGASRTGKPGKFEQAQGGTIFLDEVGDMPLDAQANLLRVLQEKTITRIGGNTKMLDVRVIAATNKNLLEEVAAGRFRQDLYYRLTALNVHIPPLRERPDDIWPLVQHFMEKHAGLEQSEYIVFERQARQAMMQYAWPGNIRELENVMIGLLSKTQSLVMSLKDLPGNVAASIDTSSTPHLLGIMEKDAIIKSLERCQGRVPDAAILLGISRATLYRKIKKYGLQT